MSLIIKGMKLPKHAAVNGEKDTAYKCVILAHPDNSVELVIDIKFASAYDNGHNIQRYLLTEISTPHGRLIDADAYQYSGDLIDEPTIIEAEHEPEAQKWARVGRDISKGLQEGIEAINSEVPG